MMRVLTGFIAGLASAGTYHMGVSYLEGGTGMHPMLAGVIITILIVCCIGMEWSTED